MYVLIYQVSGEEVGQTHVTLTAGDSLTLDELSVCNAAHVTFSSTGTDRFDVTINQMLGSPVIDRQALGRLTVGPDHTVTVVSTDLYVPVNINLLPGGVLTLPRVVKLLNTDSLINGTLGGVEELTIVKSSLTFGSQAQSSSAIAHGYLNLDHITVLSGGEVHMLDDIRYIIHHYTLYRLHQVYNTSLYTIQATSSS